METQKQAKPSVHADPASIPSTHAVLEAHNYKSGTQEVKAERAEA